MPTTPFIGISILIHGAIIIFHKLFKVVRRERPIRLAPSKRQLAFSAAIVAAMFSVILMTAEGLLSASVIEKHSTVFLVVFTALWLSAQDGGAEVAAAIAGTYRAQASDLVFLLILVAAIVMVVPRIRFPQGTFAPNQGGHSVVSVSLLLSGLVIFLTGAAYIALYMLVAFGVKF